jgi:hypothetical protein
LFPDQGVGQIDDVEEARLFLPLLISVVPRAMAIWVLPVPVPVPLTRMRLCASSVNVLEQNRSIWVWVTATAPYLKVAKSLWWGNYAMRI